MNFIIPSKLPVRARGEYKVLITLAEGLLDFDSLSTIFWKMLMVSDLPFDLEKKISWHAVFRKSLQHNGQLLVKDGTLYSQSYFPRNTWLKQDETREFTLFLNDSVYSTVINLQGVHNNVDPKKTRKENLEKLFSLGSLPLDLFSRLLS
ncbi:hypothetical protein YC2023_005674 [Brassica napus]